MFTSLSLKNVRSWQEETIALSPLTVLVGPNASGKTTVLEVLHLLSQLAGPRHPSEVLKGWLSPDRFLRDGAPEFAMSLQGGSGDAAFSVSYVSAIRPEGGFYQRVEWSSPGAEYKTEWHSGPESKAVGPLPWGDGEPKHPWLSELRSCSFLHLDPRVLARPSYSEDENPRIEFDGEGLAAALAYMKLERVDDFSRIEEGLRRIVPSVKAVRLPRAKVYRNVTRSVAVDEMKTQLAGKQEFMGNRVVFETSTAANVHAAQAGEGTLLVLGLISMLTGPTHPRHALVDDIDMRLHPKAQGELVSLLRSMMLDQRAAEQFIGTTHSPFFLQHLSASEVVVVSLSAAKSIAGRLSEHPEYEKWKDVMGVGEFWSFAGESWLPKK